MGRHGTARKPKPDSPIHRLWRRLPEDFRARVWEMRRRWRGWHDRRHTPPGAWDAALPRDPSMWSDDLNWGSFKVAADMRAHRRRISALSESSTDPALRLHDLFHHRHDQETP